MGTLSINFLDSNLTLTTSWESDVSLKSLVEEVLAKDPAEFSSRYEFPLTNSEVKLEGASIVVMITVKNLKVFLSLAQRIFTLSNCIEIETMLIE